MKSYEPFKPGKINSVNMYVGILKPNKLQVPVQYATYHFLTLMCLCGSFISLSMTAKFRLLPICAFGVSTTAADRVEPTSMGGEAWDTTGPCLRAVCSRGAHGWCTMGVAWCTMGATWCTTGDGIALTANTGICDMAMVVGGAMVGELLPERVTIRGGLGASRGRDLTATIGSGRGGATWRGGGGLEVGVNGLLRTYSLRKGPRSIGSSLEADMTATGECLGIIELPSL